MYRNMHRAAARLLPLALAGPLIAGAGPDLLRTLAQASLALTEIALEICQAGLAVLRVCGL